MKKTLLFIVTVGLLSCAKPHHEEPSATGKIRLQVSSLPDIEISNSKANPTIDDNYQLLITNSEGTTIKSDTYDNLKSPFTLNAANGYTISAENCTPAEAISTTAVTTEGITSYGQSRYAGNSTFNVTAGTLTDVSFTCTMANLKVSVCYDATFSNAFTNYSVKVYENSAQPGAITFDNTATLNSPVAYFNLPVSNGELTMVISATRNSDNVQKSYTKTISNLNGAEWHKVTVAASTTNGQAGLEITVNTECTDVTHNVPIDPYES